MIFNQTSNSEAVARRKFHTVWVLCSDAVPLEPRLTIDMKETRPTDVEMKLRTGSLLLERRADFQLLRVIYILSLGFWFWSI